jgi:hypothetical protein
MRSWSSSIGGVCSATEDTAAFRPECESLGSATPARQAAIGSCRGSGKRGIRLRDGGVMLRLGEHLRV